MSMKPLQQVVQRQEKHRNPSYEEKMSWYMRWFALIVLATGYIASIITGIIGFSITRDTRFLAFISPTLFTPAIFYLVPMDNKRYELKKLKIQSDAELKAQRRESRQKIRSRYSQNDAALPVQAPQ